MNNNYNNGRGFTGIHFIWYISHNEQHSVSFAAKRATIHHSGNSLCKAQRYTLQLFCRKCFLIKQQRKTQSTIKSLFSAVFL